MQIRDGAGSGRLARVNEQGELEVRATTITGEHRANHVWGEAYSLHCAVTPSGAGDTFIYIKNTDDKDMILEGFNLKLGANQYIDIYLNDTGVPTNTSTRVPANLNSGSGKVAQGDFYDSPAIRSLTDGALIYRIYHSSSGTTVKWNFDQDVILRKNGVITFRSGAAGGVLVDMTIDLHYEEGQN